jgi:uncharacterized membrane protein YdjX (TVP38/TMEM64 family)
MFIKELFKDLTKTKSLLVLFAYSLFIILVAVFFKKYLDQETLQLLVEKSGQWGVLTYLFIEILYIVFTPFLNTFILIASGFLFGGLLGALINFIAAISSLLLIVFLVKKYGRPLLKKLVSENFYRHFDKIVAKVGPMLLLVAYVVPFSPDDELTYIVAAGPLGFKRFILPVVLGSIGKASYSYIGDLGGEGVIIAAYTRVSVLVVGLILIFIQEYILKRNGN